MTFKMPAPKPGLLAHFATSYAQGWQPKHFLSKFHPAINSDADKLAKSMGFDDGYAVIAAITAIQTGQIRLRLLNSPEKVANLPPTSFPP